MSIFKAIRSLDRAGLMFPGWCLLWALTILFAVAFGPEHLS